MFRIVLILSGLLFIAPVQVTSSNAPHSPGPSRLMVPPNPFAPLAGTVNGEGKDGDISKNSQTSSQLSSQPYSESASGEGQNTALASAGTYTSAEIRYGQEYTRFPEKLRLPDRDVFILAMTGFEKLQRQGKLVNERYLTIVDFRLPSTRERLWVLDMVDRKIVFKTLVAHGRNSGELYATEFSDVPQSFQSSLGFYLASETYSGKHGLSLRLDGLEPGINGHARDRAIVMHGADYVSQNFIQENGRLGRSQGCPAIPLEISETIINTIQGQSCLFIYQPGSRYVERSKLLRDVKPAG